MSDRFIIAVDGPAGSGKSTIARRVASELGYRYIDTGAMYRALAWEVLRQGLALHDRRRIIEAVSRTALEVFPRKDAMGIRVNGRDITGEIRTEAISTATSAIAAIPEVRSQLVELYRAQGSAGGVVMEGRDIGTVAFPDAELKVYLTASVETRAHRRLQQHENSSVREDLESVKSSIRQRDERDTRREHAPLACAPDAVEIDTTCLSVDEVTRQVVELARRRIASMSEN